jgi:hypothetical protein
MLLLLSRLGGPAYNQSGSCRRKRLRPGSKPGPGPPGVGSRCTTYTEMPPGCTPRLQWGSVVAWSSTAATTGFVRGHRAPVTLQSSTVCAASPEPPPGGAGLPSSSGPGPNKQPPRMAKADAPDVPGFPTSYAHRRENAQALYLNHHKKKKEPRRADQGRRGLTSSLWHVC